MTEASIAHILTNCEFGTTVVETTVTTATNPVTTWKKHRVEGIESFLGLGVLTHSRVLNGRRYNAPLREYDLKFWP